MILLFALMTFIKLSWNCTFKSFIAMKMCFNVKEGSLFHWGACIPYLWAQTLCCLSRRLGTRLQMTSCLLCCSTPAYCSIQQVVTCRRSAGKTLLMQTASVLVVTPSHFTGKNMKIHPRLFKWIVSFFKTYSCLFQATIHFLVPISARH